MNEAVKPPRSFTIRVNDAEREIKSSYGLVNEMTRVIGSPDRLPLIFADHDLRDQFLCVLLAERSKTGKITQAFDMEDSFLDYEEVSELISWATQHMLGFTMLSAEKAVAMIAGFQKTMEGLTASSNGSAP